MQELCKALGQRVRELRLKRGYSQEAFADHCGVHRTFMGTIERGETNLSFQNLAKIAAGLEVTLSRLLSGVEQRAARLASDTKPASLKPRRAGRDPAKR